MSNAQQTGSLTFERIYTATIYKQKFVLVYVPFFWPSKLRIVLSSIVLELMVRVGIEFIDDNGHNDMHISLCKMCQTSIFISRKIITVKSMHLLLLSNANSQCVYIKATFHAKAYFLGV